MYKCILIHRISYERALIPTPDNFFVTEFDGPYSLQKYLDRRKNGWPYEILHDTIFDNFADCIKYVRTIMKPTYKCYHQYNTKVALLDVMDDVACIELVMKQ
jgi:hypothetical protein